MQVELFKALRAAKIGNEEASGVVEHMEGYIAMKIKESTEGIERQLKFQNILMVFLGTMSTIAAAIGGYIALIK